MIWNRKNYVDNVQRYFLVSLTDTIATLGINSLSERHQSILYS